MLHDQKSTRVYRGLGRVSILLIAVATYGLLLGFQKLGFMALKQRLSIVHSVNFVRTPAAIDQIWSSQLGV